ncbi:programmed cell death protein 1 [Rhinatrema bivittatum]|uniref:programmed cell death protein 1 n=1 Tax=Rhinatrema bivittatum TaxID=194408 RepID=UPI001127BC89|nr:programmed cell death protein 1 [Rhinatrema bivittatum]
MDRQKMHFCVFWGLTLHLQKIALCKGAGIAQTPGQMFLTAGDNATLNCSIRFGDLVNWYKEQQDGSLQRIHQSYKYSTEKDQKYSSKVDSDGETFSLLIHHLQRSDSGIYYCGIISLANSKLGKGSTVIVTEAGTSIPSLSILVPVMGDDPLPGSVVLLCVASDVTPRWAPVLWDIGGNVTQGQPRASAIDPEGHFSLRSQVIVPGETWRRGVQCTCSVKDNATGETISASVPQGPDSRTRPACNSVIFVGCPFILILLLTELWVLLCRKHPARGHPGRSQETARAQLPETDYAFVRHITGPNAP